MIDPANPSTRFTRSVWISICLLVLSLIFLAGYILLELQIKQTQRVRDLSFSLAQELRVSSNDLTRMARTYAVTGDPVYRQHYQEILDIRDGKTPPPLRYQDIYWDLILTDNRRPRPTGGLETPLLERIRAAGFTPEELAKLELATVRSDALSKTECDAMGMSAAKGPLADTDRSRAIRILHDTHYHEAKAGIMRPIYEFELLTDQRTQSMLKERQSAALVMLTLFILFYLIFFYMLWHDFRILNTTLGGTLEELHTRISRLANGDFISDIPVHKGMEKSVMSWLSETRKELSMLDSERKSAVERSNKLAYYDPLTGLPNRRLLLDRLRQMMNASKRSGRYAALLFLDLDNFKPLNDEHGHDIGDLLLIEMALRIGRCVREMDTCARFGGDECVVLLGDLDTDPAKSIAETNVIATTLCTTLADPYVLAFEKDGVARTLEHRSTVSIGATLFINHESTPEEILKRADVAMYQAKQQGGNRCHFAEMHQPVTGIPARSAMS